MLQGQLHNENDDDIDEDDDEDEDQAMDLDSDMVSKPHLKTVKCPSFSAIKITAI